jgi:hypothetical protein
MAVGVIEERRQWCRNRYSSKWRCGNENLFQFQPNDGCPFERRSTSHSAILRRDLIRDEFHSETGVLPTGAKIDGPLACMGTTFDIEEQFAEVLIRTRI